MSDLQKVTCLLEDRFDQLVAAVPPRLQPLIAEALLQIAQRRCAQNEAQAGRRTMPTESCAKRVL